MKVDTHKMLPKLPNIKAEPNGGKRRRKREKKKEHFANKETSEANRSVRLHFKKDNSKEPN